MISLSFFIASPAHRRSRYGYNRAMARPVLQRKLRARRNACCMLRAFCGAHRTHTHTDATRPTKEKRLAVASHSRSRNMFYASRHTHTHGTGGCHKPACARQRTQNKLNTRVRFSNYTHSHRRPIWRVRRAAPHVLAAPTDLRATSGGAHVVAAQCGGPDAEQLHSSTPRTEMHRNARATRAL